jgi:hypothetical protein
MHALILLFHSCVPAYLFAFFYWHRSFRYFSSLLVTLFIRDHHIHVGFVFGSAFEIDGYNRMWVVDSGRINSGVAAAGAAKLLVFNLSSTPGMRFLYFRFPLSLLL